MEFILSILSISNYWDVLILWFFLLILFCDFSSSMRYNDRCFNY